MNRSRRFSTVISCAKPGRARLQQRLVVVGLAAEPVALVLAIGLRAQVPLLRRRGQQRPVRRADSQDDVSHSISHSSDRSCSDLTTLPVPLRTTGYRSGRHREKCRLQPLGQPRQHDSGEAR